MPNDQELSLKNWKDVAGDVRTLVKNVIADLSQSVSATQGLPPLFPGGIGEISLVVKVGAAVGVDVEVTIIGVKNTSDKQFAALTETELTGGMDRCVTVGVEGTGDHGFHINWTTNSRDKKDQTVKFRNNKTPFDDPNVDNVQFTVPAKQPLTKHVSNGARGDFSYDWFEDGVMQSNSKVKIE